MKVLETQFKKLAGKVKSMPVSLNRRAVLMREGLWRCVRFDGAYWTDDVLEDAHRVWAAAGRPRCVDVYRAPDATFRLHRRTTTGRR